MEAKLFKNVTTYRNLAGRYLYSEHFDKFDEHPSEDPSGGQWRTLGFAPISTNEYWIDVQGAGKLCLVQLNERILPGAVQKEKIVERLASIELREGRKVNKKEYASIRDDVAMELLPKAFIRRKLIPVLFRGDRVYVFSSSAKLCDDVTGLLVGTINDPAVLVMAQLGTCVESAPAAVLTAMAKENSGADFSESYRFEATFGAVLKGADKKAIRIKDVDINGHDVHSLLEQDYTVVQLDVAWFDGENSGAVATLTINERLVITKLVLEGIKGVDVKASAADKADAFISTAWLVATTLGAIVNTLIESMGGLRKEPVKPAVADEDDDL